MKTAKDLTVYNLLMLLVVYILLTLICLKGTVAITDAEYQTERQRIITNDEKQRVGGTLVLNAKEQRVNAILLKAKRSEFESARVNNTIFPPSVNFFLSKKLIEKSKVFQIIRQLPKGGALHTHISALASLEWLIKNVTYRPNLFMCFNSEGVIEFKFSNGKPSDSSCQWESVQKLRTQSGDPDIFDQYLYNNASIVVDDPDSAYVTLNDVWKKFDNFFPFVHGLYRYAPMFREYYFHVLQEFLDDNVQYIEIRGSLSPLYELDGSRQTKEDKLKLYRDYTKEFVKDNPDFIGVKIIQNGHKHSSRADILDDLKLFMQLYTKYSDTLVGFDLVGQEGPGRPLTYYIDDLLYPSRLDPPVNVPYFFHAGETDWEGTQVDLNLVDAVLLNSSRIGHGFALYKHPEVMKLIKEKDIAIEVNPISNQVLKLVEDLRNHGAVTLFAENYPVVVSSDDPSAWGALPLSHDFYMAFMAMTTEDAGLTVLKQLAINSIKYSAMTHSEKARAMAKWQQKWNQFIDAILRQDTHGFLIG